MFAQLRRVRLWLGFGILIATPALVLAVLGLRTAAWEEVERRQQIRDQQSQTALLADAAVSLILREIEEDVARPHSIPARESFQFQLERSGTLTFGSDRVFFSDSGEAPPAIRTHLSAELRSASEEALAAEVRGDLSRALALYQRLSRIKELSAWASLAVERLKNGRGGFDQTTALQKFDAADRNALTPEGTPLLLVWATRFSEQQPTGLLPILNSVLSELRSGRWWLNHQQRKLYDAKLSSLIMAGRGTVSVDTRLIDLALVEQAIRRAAPFPHDRSARLLVEEASTPVLLILVPESGESTYWNGAALVGPRIGALVSEALKSTGANLSYSLAVTNSTGKLMWGDASAAHGGHPFSLRSLSGWDLRVSNPFSPSDRRRRWLWYGFVALLMAMLVLGLVVTGRIFRREMELARLQADFAAGVTHEFKSPITGIRLLVERIRGGRVRTSGDLREYCDAIRQETDHLDQLVNRLLETHRIQSGQNQYNIVPHCVTEIAEGTVGRLRAQADERRITITLDTDDATREIEIDRAAIQDAIYNLIENAIKYSPPDTHVAITVRHEQGEMRFTVQDQGIGIDPADIGKVFDRFYRGRLGQAQSVSGTGLGLTLVKAAAEGHGGKVELHSVPGAGSEFRLRIPIRTQEPYVASLDRG